MTDLLDFTMFAELIRGLKFIGEPKIEALSKPPVTFQVVVIFFKSSNKIDSKSLPKLHGLKCKPPLLKSLKVMSLFLIISRYKSCKCLFCLIAVKLELSLSVRVIKLEVVNPE